MADQDTAFEYKAFISYSHRDQGWAQWLLKNLEQYRIPRDLVGTPNLAGDIVPEKVGKFFRDRDDASAAGSLTEEIQRALRSSEHMIVVASPASARSRYVNQEVLEFAALQRGKKKPGRILTLIVEGEPNISAGSEPAPNECFPPALRGGLMSEDGTAFEPLAADARSIGDGKTRALSKLVAGLLDLRYDSLVRRDLVRRRQRRMVWGAIAATLLVAAAGTLWKIETDRQERVRLAEAQEQADRERRTVAAVNQAIRARDLLAEGDIAGATELARGSLVLDGSLPFVPQAYSVLYSAQVERGRARSLDLGNYSAAEAHRSFALAGNVYLDWSARGRAFVWSPLKGVTVSREVGLPTTGRKAYAIGNVGAALPGFNVTTRYWADTGNWDEVNISSLTFESLEPAAEVSINERLSIGCVSDTVVGISMPARGGGDADIAWQEKIDGLSCDSIAVIDQKLVLLGGWREIVAFDLELRREVTRYPLDEKFLLDDIQVVGNRFFAAGLSIGAVFETGKTSPLLKTTKGDASMHFAPDASAIVALDLAGDGDLVIYDIETGKRTLVPCSCLPQGFDGNGNILTLDNDRSAVLRDGKTGSVIRTLHEFETKPDSIGLIQGGEYLLAYRELSLETVAPIRRSSNAIAQSSDAANDLLSSASFVNETDVLTLAHRSEGDKLRSDVKLLRILPDQTTETVWKREDFGGGPRGMGLLWQLGRGTVALATPESVMSIPASINLLDVNTGETFHSTRVVSEPKTVQSGDYVVFEGEDAFTAFNLGNRATQKLEMPELLPADLRTWAVSGNRILIGTDEGVLVFDASADELTRRVGLADRTIHHICVADDRGDRAVLVTSSKRDGKLFAQLVVVGLDDLGTVSATEISEEQQAEMAIVAELVLGGALFRNDQMKCSSSTVRIHDSEEGTLVWPIGSDAVTLAKGAPEQAPPQAQAPLADSTLIAPDMLATAEVSFEASEVRLVAADGTLLRRIDAGSSPIVSAVFVARKSWIAAGYDNGRVRVWDANAPGAPVIDIAAGSDGISILTANPTGTKLVSGDPKGGLNAWPLYSTEELLALD